MIRGLPVVPAARSWVSAPNPAGFVGLAALTTCPVVALNCRRVYSGRFCLETIFDGVESYIKVLDYTLEKQNLKSHPGSVSRDRASGSCYDSAGYELNLFEIGVVYAAQGVSDELAECEF